jgi:RNA polymerase sigma factor (sigma-70 family)
MSDLSDFDAWYRDHHPRVLAALTVVVGGVDVAEDATAEAFVRAYERWDRVQSMQSPGGWLYQVALNYVRRRARRQAMERELVSKMAPRDVGPVALEPELWQAVRTLTERQRTAIALRYLLDLPEASVAETMGITRGTASATLVTARRKLESMLGEREPQVDVQPARGLEVSGRG